MTRYATRGLSLCMRTKFTKSYLCSISNTYPDPKFSNISSNCVLNKGVYMSNDELACIMYVQKGKILRHDKKRS